MTEQARLELVTRLMDYREQVLLGFRHISRLEEADLIQAAIDRLEDRTPSLQLHAFGVTVKPLASSPVADSPTELVCGRCGHVYRDDRSTICDDPAAAGAGSFGVCGGSLRPGSAPSPSAGAAKE